MTPIRVPPLGESIVEATISRWLKEEGEPVASGETLVELETDKVTVEVPAAKAGVLVRRMKQAGEIVKVDEVLAEVDETRAGAQPSPAPAAEKARAEGRVQSPESRAPAPPKPANAPPRAEVRASPAAQRVAAESGIDLAAVTGTGRGGVVSKPDVIEHIAGQEVARPGGTMPTPSPARPQPPGGAPPVQVIRPEPPQAVSPGQSGNGDRETRERMSTRRKRIAEHLLEAQHATAHLTTFNEIDMTAVESLRGRHKERIEKEHGVRLTFMPFFVRAACLALRQYPMVNALVDGDEIVYRHYVNMGIAVASEAGLVVPNVKDADRKGLLQIGGEIAEVARRARDGKLTMDDLTGGTFTITNGGVFGSLVSTPIINFPQVGILGLHKIQARPIVLDGAVVVRPMMYVALSYDHRIIDGQHAVLFLVRVKELMEDPALMVIDG
jgi:2-oxoglutarate dehydrogenase E2 component (dihydrolipoamide succinyltransferase)